MLAVATASGHGGVVEEDDLCLIKVDYLSAHFKIYQPRQSGHRQFCEDLPAAGESVFVMEYEHDALASMPVDFRIIKNTTGKGRFTRIDDVDAIDDLDAVTVYYRPPTVEAHVYTVLHEFSAEGDFVGIVSARHPVSGKVYAAVFPFEVGFTGVGYWPLILLILAAVQLQYLLMSGRLKRWLGRAGQPALVVLCLVAAIPAGADQRSADQLVVRYESSLQPVEINKMHSWLLRVETADGRPVEDATIEVDGGMPEHDHGLPTQPRVTAELGGGSYRVDGLRFHMRGDWELVFTIRHGKHTSTVVVSLTL